MGIPENTFTPEFAFKVNVVITEKNNLPCLEIRRITTDQEIIKLIVSCAFWEKPIIVVPQFSDKLKSIDSLIRKGILYKNENDQQYYFLK